MDKKEKLLSFKDMNASYIEGTDEYISYRNKKRRNGAIDEAKEVDSYSPENPSFKGDRYSRRDHGTHHSIIKTHQSGKHLKNAHGGYPPVNVGSRKHIDNKWKDLQKRYNEKVGPNKWKLSKFSHLAKEAKSADKEMVKESASAAYKHGKKDALLGKARSNASDQWAQFSADYHKGYDDHKAKKESVDERFGIDKIVTKVKELGKDYHKGHKTYQKAVDNNGKDGNHKKSHLALAAEVARMHNFHGRSFISHLQKQVKMGNMNSKYHLGRISNEEVEDTNEALSMMQRRQTALRFKRNKSKIKIGRDRAKKRVASKDVLMKRARKHARNEIMKKMTKAKSKSELDFARREAIEKRLSRMKGKIDTVARKLYPVLRKKEMERKRG